MRTEHGFLLRFAVAIAAIASCVAVQAPLAQTIVDEWASVKAPPPRS